jgi:DNA polymerase-1
MTQQFDWFYGETPRPGPRVAFDIETNGLLPDVSKIHSLVIKDLDTKVMWSCMSDDGMRKALGPSDRSEENVVEESVENGLDYLSNASIVFGHNIIGYDIPVLKHLHPDFSLSGIARDTLILAKMIWPMDAPEAARLPALA